MLTNENFDSCFRDREISGIIYFIKLKDATTYCIDGQPVKLNFDEAKRLKAQKGEGIEGIIADRPKNYDKPKPITAQGEHIAKKRGRPKK